MGEKKGFFSRLVEGLTKTRDNIVSGIDSVFHGFSKIDDEFYEELEEILIMGDLGVKATEAILDDLREKVKANHVKEPAECKQLLIDSIKQQMQVGETAYRFEEETSVVLVIGVNGVGKTTTVGKLAGKLKEQGKKVVIAGADTFRAAAGDQLKEWADRSGVDMIGGTEGADPGSVVYDATAAAKARNADVLLVDTAGRLHIDETLMDELKQIKELTQPNEILLVVDAMTGQDAVNVADSFNQQLGITGVVITKLDGDTRGGAALSIRSVTGAPIKFIGSGEKLTDLEVFHPDRMASRILGMGDMLTLIEKAQQDYDEKKAEELAQKMRENSFDFNDFIEQLDQVMGMGPLEDLIKMIPGMNQVPGIENVKVDPKDVERKKAMVYSMTPAERANPDLLNPSRRRRIAAGSGNSVVEVNRMIKQFKESRKMMQQMSKGDMNIPGMDQMFGSGVKGKLGKMAMNRMIKKNKKKKKKRK